MIDLFFCPLLNHVVEKLAIFWVLVFWFSYNERCLFQRNLPWDFKESVKKIQNSIKVVESHKFEINQAIHNLEIMDISQMDRELNNYKIVFEEY